MEQSKYFSREKQVADMQNLKNRLLSVLKSIKEEEHVNEKQLEVAAAGQSPMTRTKRKKLQSALTDLFLKLKGAFDKLFIEPEKSHEAISDGKINSIKEEIIKELDSLAELIQPEKEDSGSPDQVETRPEQKQLFSEENTQNESNKGESVEEATRDFTKDKDQEDRVISIQNSKERTSRDQMEPAQDAPELRDIPAENADFIEGRPGNLISFGPRKSGKKVAKTNAEEPKETEKSQVRDPYLFTVKKVSKTFAELIRPTKEAHNFSIMAKMAKFLKTKAINKRINDKADESIKSMQLENQSRSEREGSVYTVKTDQKGSRRNVAIVRKTGDPMSEEGSVDVVSRFDEIDQKDNKKSSRSLSTKFRYNRNPRNRGEDATEVYGVDSQSIKAGGTFHGEFGHESVQMEKPKMQTLPPKQFMRHSAHMIVSSSKKEVPRGQPAKHPHKVPSLSSVPLESESFVAKELFPKREVQIESSMPTGPEDNQWEPVETQKKSKPQQELVTRNSHNQTKEEESKKSIQNAEKETVNQSLIGQTKVLRQSVSNMSREKPRAMTEPVQETETNEIIVSNVKPKHAIVYTKHVDQHSSMNAEKILNNSNQQNLKSVYSENLKSNFSKHKGRNENRVQKVSDKQSIYSQLSAYSNENGTKSRIKQKVIVPERSPSHYRPNPVGEGSKPHLPRKTVTPDQNSKPVTPEKRVSRENTQNRPEMNSLKGPSGSQKVTYVRTYTNAQFYGKRPSRKVPQFDSGNTFDNFESHHLTSKSLCVFGSQYVKWRA